MQTVVKGCGQYERLVRVDHAAGDAYFRHGNCEFFCAVFHVNVLRGFDDRLHDDLFDLLCREFWIIFADERGDTRDDGRRHGRARFVLVFRARD